MLKRRGIAHAVLNAKYHQQEAEIVARAGRPGAVTIATNMAGRGTDIKLGPGVVKGRTCLVRSPAGVGDCEATRGAAACLADMPCGLHIIGTERHEARRIDRQLRGRSGRQGDPGSSRFFLALEDDLMRLFGGERVSALMERMGVQEGEVIEHDFVTKAIERAQKRVEAQNFEIRKHLLEYDDVMNQQREVVYGIRKQILQGESLREEIGQLIDQVVEHRLAPAAAPRGRAEEEPAAGFTESLEELERVFLVPFPLGESAAQVDEGRRIAHEAYRAREAEWGEALTREVERQVYLRVIDDHWKDHLYEIDLLRGGIGLRAYGQKDPLLEYKAEAFGMFEALMQRIAEDALRFLFRVQVQTAPPPAPVPPTGGQAMHTPVQGYAAPSVAGAGRAPAGPPPRPAPGTRPVEKVGRNEPCPCGSGRKYKHCHGAQ
jgi:preprotein translocase subunit SecA